MKKRFLSILLLLVGGAGVLRAQTFNFIADREPVASVDGLWRFHTGDDPAWASPDFDDSHWTLLQSDRPWTKQGYSDYGGFAWYRFKVQVPDGTQPLCLYLPPILTGYQLYADGKLIGKNGSTLPTRNPSFSDPAVFRIPTASPGPHTLQIAIRVWNYPSFTTWLGGGMREPGSTIGSWAPLAEHLRLYHDARALFYANNYGYALLATLVGLTTLGLFLFYPVDREYLWFSILLFTQAIGAALFVLSNLNVIPFSLWRLLFDIADAISVVSALCFFSVILHLGRSTKWWIACIAAAVSPLSVALFYFQWVGVPVAYAVQICCLLPAYIWMIFQRALGVIRNDASARILFPPSLLFYGFGVYDFFLRVRWQLGEAARVRWQLGGQGHEGFVENPIMRYPFPLYPGDVINFIFILSLLLFLVRRFSLARQRETRLSTEMEAARTIQSILISDLASLTPGFKVESAYLPANEVGGDFFQVLPAADGSLLIVVGDVSGKGLKAAMTVSTIVGALRNERERRPAKVLSNLNLVLQGQIDGFATCCAALIEPDGSVAFANAGNLSPYSNGFELTLDGGLPLGIAADAAWEESHHLLALGDRITFISDGVVEATNEMQELFGFERVKQISNQPPAQIAQAARQFGQQDDISIISVTRIPPSASAVA
jgi:hypothetical protein